MSVRVDCLGVGAPDYQISRHVGLEPGGFADRGFPPRFLGLFGLLASFCSTYSGISGFGFWVFGAPLGFCGA